MGGAVNAVAYALGAVEFQFLLNYAQDVRGAPLGVF